MQVVRLQPVQSSTLNGFRVSVMGPSHTCGPSQSAPCYQAASHGGETGTNTVRKSSLQAYISSTNADEHGTRLSNVVQIQSPPVTGFPAAVIPNVRTKTPLYAAQLEQMPPEFATPVIVKVHWKAVPDVQNLQVQTRGVGAVDPLLLPDADPLLLT